MRSNSSCDGSINLFKTAAKLAELYRYDLFSELNVDDQSFLTDTSRYKKLSYDKLAEP